jgi:hypothetical protein
MEVIHALFLAHEEVLHLAQSSDIAATLEETVAWLIWKALAVALLCDLQILMPLA